MKKFKENFTYEKRLEESTKILTKYPDRIPIIVEIRDEDVNEINLDKKKYLVPYDLTVGQFIYIIRKRLKLNSEKALFMFCKNNIPSNSTMVSNLYQKYRDDDKFLYVMISLENCFG